MSRNDDKAKLRAEIDALRDYDPERLRRRYHELTGVDAATFGARFLQRRCAHRLQELAFGGLTAAELETLAYIADHDPQINKSLREAPRSANDSRGVTYRREYHGRNKHDQRSSLCFRKYIFFAWRSRFFCGFFFLFIIRSFFAFFSFLFFCQVPSPHF